MLDASDSIALIALVVSLVALIATSLQLLQQYFSTAQGYNRCSRRFIGEWCRFRHRRYLWREFRFEVTFVRPHIYLGSVHDTSPERAVPSTTLRSPLHLITSIRSDELWRANYMGKSFLVAQLGNDLVDSQTHASWTLFLKHVRIYSQHATKRLVSPSDKSMLKPTFSRLGVDARDLEHGAETVSQPPYPKENPGYGICIRFEPCTWDDLPGNAGKLTGVILLRDLAVLSRLLGLNWSDGPFLQNNRPQPAAISSDNLHNYHTGLHAAGNRLMMAEKSAPLLHYQQWEAMSPHLQRPRKDTFIIHQATLAMFYGHIIPDPLLLPEVTSPLAISGECAWDTLSQRMWLQNQSDTRVRSSLVNCLPGLCSLKLSKQDLFAVRVPKPHHYILGPFVRPKIARIFRRGLETLLKKDQSCILTSIAQAIDELEQFSVRESASGSRDVNCWTACQGEDPMWAHLEETEADIFFRRVHHWLDRVQSELAQLVQRSDESLGVYSAFYWDLLCSWLEFAFGFKNGDDLNASTAHGPFAQWRNIFKALFEHFDIIEEGVRRRGKRRAVMVANGVVSQDFGSHFDVLNPCKDVIGYKNIISSEIRDACLAMVFRAMCWYVVHQ
ncbi:hypothetical protein ABZX51_002138 [Aspergillus tubingensis]